MKLAHIADSHINQSRDLDEWTRVHRAFLDQAQAERVDVILHAGDVFDRRSTVDERNRIVAWVREAAEIAPVVFVRGNHDAPGDLLFLQKLQSAHPIHVAEEPKVILATEEIAVVCLPWFDKAQIAAMAEATDTAREIGERAMGAARLLLSTLRQHAEAARTAGAVPVLLGHVQIAGSETSTGQTLIGQTVELSPGDIRDVGCAYAALGHIHKAQEWYDGTVRYAGSPFRQNFGETEPKSWTRVEILDDGSAVSTPIPLPAREIVLLEADYTAGETLDLPDDLAGCLVRVRYSCRPEQLATIDQDAIREHAHHAGADGIQIEARVVHEARVRSEAIRNARDTWERLLAYWDATGTEMTDEERERMRQMLAEIENQAEPKGKEVAA